MTELTEKEDPTYYGIIPADVRYDNELEFGARLMFAEFSALTKKDGYAYPSNKYLAKLYNVSTDTVSRWINKLADKEYIYVRMVLSPEDKKVIQRRIYTDYRNYKVDSQYLNIFEYKKTLKSNTLSAQIKIPIRMDTDTLSAQMPIGIRTDAEENNTRYNNTSNNISSYEDSADAEKNISPSEKVCQEEKSTDIESVINNKTENNNKELNSDNSSLGIQINNINQDEDNKIISEEKNNLNSTEKVSPRTEEKPSWFPEEKTKKTKKPRVKIETEPTPHSQVKELYRKGFEYLQKKGDLDSRLKPVLNGAAINKRLTDLLGRFSVEQFKVALRESLTDKYIIEKGYPFLLILSDSVITRLYNQAIIKQPKPEEPKRHFEKSIYEYCPDCGIGYSVWGECIICGRKKPERIVDTSNVSKTMLRSE